MKICALIQTPRRQESTSSRPIRLQRCSILPAFAPKFVIIYRCLCVFERINLTYSISLFVFVVSLFFPYTRRHEDLRVDPNPAPTGKHVLKTHSPSTVFNYEPAVAPKFVTIFRDPKEVIASAYPFMLAGMGIITNPGAGGTDPNVGVGIEEWIDILFEQKNILHDLAYHTASYWNRRHLDNYLFLNFRDVKADLRGSVVRVAELMEVELSPEEIDAVCEKASFAYMQRIKHKFLFEGVPTVMRRGESGGVRSEIGREQCDRIDEHMRALLLEKAPDFPYDEMCSQV